MSIKVEIRAVPRGWQRWIVVGHTAFYLVLFISTTLALFDQRFAWQQHTVTVCLTVLLSGWYWFFLVRHPQWWRQPLPMLLYLSGAILFWVLLSQFSPSYVLIVYILYPHVFGLLPLFWALPSAIALASVVSWQQIVSRGQPFSASGSIIAFSVATIVFNTLLTLWIETVIKRSSERQLLIDQLHTTRQELATAERQSGILTERQRLAHDIHDTLTQGFISIIMHLEVAEQLLPQEQQTVGHHLQLAKSTARTNLAEARRLIWALRPESLEHASFPDALALLTERWSVESIIPSQIIIDGDKQPLPSEIEVTLLRVAQEALANIYKHAQARSITITLSYMTDRVMLDIQDDGKGFVSTLMTTLSDQSGFGLTGMRERVEQVGGMVFIESEPGEGTIITATFPLSMSSCRHTTNYRRKSNDYDPHPHSR
ncbi:MAG: sensor histidine kinase [Ktedonobacteraceae bacterium]|nr:sensor histidine kinase [Ktedonobacteraceae bacterium]